MATIKRRRACEIRKRILRSLKQGRMDFDEIVGSVNSRYYPLFGKEEIETVLDELVNQGKVELHPFHRPPRPGYRLPERSSFKIKIPL